jgi:molybdopterin/thiamine biosynthesis adenylyltransferase
MNALMNTSSPVFERNLGFMSVSEQERLNNSTVAVAGAGGDGGMLALQLARLGVGEIRLADPDPFEPENINRQAVCTTKTVGSNKAAAVGAYINDINPNIAVKLYEEGVTAGNAEEFVSGSNLLIDETEYTIHHIGVMLARAARRENIPNLQVLNIGFGAQVTSYMPDGKTFEERLGIDPNSSIEEVAAQQVSLLKWLAKLPGYIDTDVLERVEVGEISAPTVAPGVAIAAGFAATEAFLHLSGGKGRTKPIIAPHTLHVDAMERQTKVVKNPNRALKISLAKLVLKNKFNQVPKVAS